MHIGGAHRADADGATVVFLTLFDLNPQIAASDLNVFVFDVII